MKHFKSAFIAPIMAIACGVILSAQAQPPAAPQQPGETRQTSAAAATTTITGCVYQEKNVPGRSPNVAERAGILEDYILASVSPSAQSATPGAAATAGAAASSTKLGTMYKLEFVDDEKLRSMVGKRVEVSGRVDKEAGDSARSPAAAPSTTETDKAIGRDRIDLAEFEVSSIREVSGSCPASPGAQ